MADEERSKPGTGIQKLSSDELRNYIVTGDVRSLSTSTDSGRDGGYTVIPELDREVMRQLQDDSVMRVIATVKTAKSNEFQKLVSTGGATVGRGTEGSARSETNTPKIERVTIKLNPIYAYPKTTQEILDFQRWIFWAGYPPKLPTRSPAPKRMILLMATVTASRKASWLTPVRRPVTNPRFWHH